MEQIYIKASLLTKLDNKPVDERIKTLESKFKDEKIQDYICFLEYIQNQGEGYQFHQYSDENMKSILIEFHKFCRQIQQEINCFQDNRIIQLLGQVDDNIKSTLIYLLIDLLDNEFIKNQIPKLQNQITKFGLSQDNVNKIQIITQQCQQQENKKISSCKSFKILILGGVGTGKTTLANKLNNFLSSKDTNQNFTNQIDGGTKNINVQYAKYKNINIDILDSPSFGNTETNLQHIIEDICKVAKTINMILYCFNATILRYNRQDLLTISIIQGLYKESWDDLFVTFNFMDLSKQSCEKETVIDSINKRIKSKIPHQNILYNDDLMSEKISQLIEQQHIAHQYKKGFKKMTIPNMKLIEERCKEFSF